VIGYVQRRDHRHAGIDAKIEAPEDWTDPVAGDVQPA
jgi:hypothetical protein